MKNLRLKYFDLSPELMSGFRAVKVALEKSVVEQKLIELVYLRVSQINGCAYCLNLHTNSLLKDGETQRRIAEVAGWRVSDQYSEKERAALNWAEQLTNISTSHADDESYEALKKVFSDKEISDLTFAISLMNGMNRLAISMRQ
ncbi:MULTISPECIES: carboxymuconolactone decarboxylase family protein [Bartonella]|uniref:carboxymuconolactone decarboxylase family protein n=2 Tax=Bartonella TaxID=773 RepID=UPI001E10E114|nr:MULTISPECIES: carboxymuconolactone decarboxylase family protein [Bartonella]MBI0141143.1 carboxymuconolactone decarboxylase family protein [Bartonella choladocola]MBH9993918.1 carboxymuconolactone decarboxylase family protein [Bartonella sp. P0291]MBH9997737.1 carboxymuconolactone decarboxylase family protein [Bartonella sp. M0192]MBH9999896.1 carboxymuconolactone decarboxylase family protein [Bartonella sp. M0191]MBI0008110.1 carboxymuconolactone decarboxylase family protein [Bartonella sp